MEDDYVMNSKSHDDNASSSSSLHVNIVNGNNDSSIWYCDDQLNPPKFLTSTPKLGSSSRLLDFKSPGNLAIVSDTQSFNKKSFKETSVHSKKFSINDENFKSPANLKKIYYASLINKNNSLKEASSIISKSNLTNEQLLFKMPEVNSFERHSTDKICLKDLSKNEICNSLTEKKILLDDSDAFLECLFL